MVLHKCLALATCIHSKSNWVCLLFTEFAKNPEKQTKFEGFPPVGVDTPMNLNSDWGGIKTVFKTCQNSCPPTGRLTFLICMQLYADMMKSYLPAHTIFCPLLGGRMGFIFNTDKESSLYLRICAQKLWTLHHLQENWKPVQNPHLVMLVTNQNFWQILWRHTQLELERMQVAKARYVCRTIGLLFWTETWVWLC